MFFLIHRRFRCKIFVSYWASHAQAAANIRHNDELLWKHQAYFDMHTFRSSFVRSKYCKYCRFILVLSAKFSALFYNVLWILISQLIADANKKLKAINKPPCSLL